MTMIIINNQTTIIRKGPVKRVEVADLLVIIGFIYSRTSIARTPMARLPWLIRTCFWVPRNLFQENKYLGKFCHFIMKLYVEGTHWNRLIEAILMSTLNIQLLYRRLKRFALIIHDLLNDVASGLTLNGSNYPYLKQIFMIPKRFEPSKFDCKWAQWTPVQ